MSVNLKELLSKDHITNLYKLVLAKSDDGITKKEKGEILDVLMVNMKKTYKTLHKDKINQNNFNSIKNQFNNICITETLNNKKKPIKKKEKSVPKINLQERPTTQSRHIDDSLQNNRLENFFGNNENDNFASIDELYGNSNNNDNDYRDRPMFSSGNDLPPESMSIQDRLQQLETSRGQFNKDTGPKDIPDFLKPTKVGKVKEDFRSMPLPPQNNNNSNNNNLENSGNLNSLDGFLSSDDNYSNFSSINIKVDDNKFNDNISVQDRLAKLESERGQVNIPTPQNQMPVNQQQPPPQQPPVFQQQPPPQQPPVFQQQPPPQQPPPQQQQPQEQPPVFNQQSPPQQIPNKSNIEYENKFNEMYNEIRMLKEELSLLRNNNQSVKKVNKFTHKDLQLEINKTESKYTYRFSNINNVVGIKLISYSLPLPRVNINNCEFKYTFDDTINVYEKTINIPRGLYNINNLLEKLNMNEDLSFSLNLEQKVEIKLKVPESVKQGDLIPNKKFKLLENDLLSKLGISNSITNNFLSSIMAENNYDIRLPNRIFMYIINLEKERPFGILNFNGTSSCHLNFQNLQELNNLEILFLDENKNIYNFNGLKYNLSFQITVLENSQEELNY